MWESSHRSGAARETVPSGESQAVVGARRQEDYLEVAHVGFC